MGTLIPAVYVNSLQNQAEPDMTITSYGTPSLYSNNGPSESNFSIWIENKRGNRPATNLTLILYSRSNFGTAEITDIINEFSTANLVLPQYHDTILEPGSNWTINPPRSPLEIWIPK
jgi:hypothetical protein